MSAGRGADDERRPRLLGEMVRRRPELARELERWRAARVRLGLGTGAELAGGLLLGIQVDEQAFRELTKERSGARGPTRSELLGALRDGAGDEEATQALLDLEERGAASAMDDSGRPWFVGEIALDPRVRAYCLGSGDASARAGAGATSTAGAELPPLGPRHDELLGHVREVLGRGSEAARLLFVIRGGWGTGRDTLLAALLALVGREPLRRSCYDLRGGSDRLEPELGGLVAVWDARQTDVTPDDQHLAARWLARSPTLAVALLDRHQDTPDVPGRRLVLLDTDGHTLEEREESWRHVLTARGADRPTAGAAAAMLARRSRAGIGLGARAVEMQAPPLPGEPTLLVVGVEEALATLARPSGTRGLVVERPEVPLERLIVAPDVAATLEQLLALAQLHPDLDAAGSRRGVKALFAGPSGTGKTMAARALATELCLPLYRVDLSSVVSKWVGETEKNLRFALEAAESAGAVLLFDEGDALMSKRAEVTRGSDRYANLEVSYLLQAIEAHAGVVVVTTNLGANLDLAFMRRFDISVEFAPPTRPARSLLWAQELGQPSFDGLERVFVQELTAAELTGGNIASAARLALALARRRDERNANEADVRAAVAAELLKTSAPVQAAQWMQRGRDRARAG